MSGWGRTSPGRGACFAASGWSVCVSCLMDARTSLCPAGSFDSFCAKAFEARNVSSKNDRQIEAAFPLATRAGVSQAGDNSRVTTSRRSDRDTEQDRLDTRNSSKNRLKAEVKCTKLSSCSSIEISCGKGLAWPPQRDPWPYRIASRCSAPKLLVSQGDHGIHAGCAPGRQPARQDSHR